MVGWYLPFHIDFVMSPSIMWNLLVPCINIRTRKFKTWFQDNSGDNIWTVGVGATSRTRNSDISRQTWVPSC